MNWSQSIASENSAIKEFDNGAFVLLLDSFSDFVGNGGETAPHDCLGHIDGNEETGSWISNTVSFGHDIVEKHGYNGSESELENDEDSITSSNLIQWAVHAWPSVSEGLPECNKNTDKFLSSIEELFLFSNILVDFDKFCACEQLHDHRWSDERRNTEFHEGSTIRSKNDSHPIEGIRASVFNDAEEGNLAAQQIH